MPEKLKIQTNFLKKTDAIAVGSNLFINKIKHKRIFFKKIICLYQKDLLYNLSGVALSSLIIRNDQAILFCTKKEHFAIEDYIFQINLTENNKYIIKVRQPLIIYRIRHMNYSSISQIEKAFNMTYDYFDKIPKKLLQNYHYQLAKKYLTNEDFPKVKKHLLLALKQLILNWRTFKIIYKALFILAK